MPVLISDKFNKAANSSGAYPALGVVASTRSAGEAVLACEDLTGWTTETPVHFSTYRLGQTGEVDRSTQTDWKGIVSGNTITNLTRIAGANDTGNAIGDYVELNPTIGWIDDIVTGLLASHNQDGSLKAGIVGTTQLADSSVTGAKINNSSVTSEKIRTGAITNTKIADGAVRTSNIDLTTIPYATKRGTADISTTGAQAIDSISIENFPVGTPIRIGVGGHVSSQTSGTHNLNVQLHAGGINGPVLQGAYFGGVQSSNSGLSLDTVYVREQGVDTITLACVLGSGERYQVFYSLNASL